MAALSEFWSRESIKAQTGGVVDSFLFSCELNSKVSSFTFKVEDDDDCEHIIVLRTVSLGDGVKDECNVVEVVSLDRDRKEIAIPVANLKPSCQLMVDMGNFELYPPVTFRLKAGSGPVHLAGNHLIVSTDVEEGDDDEGSIEDITPIQPLSTKNSGVIVIG